MSDDDKRKKIIMTEDAILYLQSALHELYWNQPVTTSDAIATISSIYAETDGAELDYYCQE
eukprot:15337289-Ditylum_brightwellii.AAC.1